MRGCSLRPWHVHSEAKHRGGLGCALCAQDTGDGPESPGRLLHGLCGGQQGTLWCRSCRCEVRSAQCCSTAGEWQPPGRCTGVQSGPRPGRLGSSRRDRPSVRLQLAKDTKGPGVGALDGDTRLLPNVCDCKKGRTLGTVGITDR